MITSDCIANLYVSNPTFFLRRLDYRVLPTIAQFGGSSYAHQVGSKAGILTKNTLPLEGRHQLFLIECVMIALIMLILTGEVETMLEGKHIDLTLLHSQPLDQPYVT